MTEQVFIEECKKIGIIPTEEQLSQLETLYNYMIEYNQNVNLTRITDKKEVYLKHYYDSLTIVKAINLNDIKTLCDVGTGAGFPGIILKIFFPDLKITLVDSLNKRIVYLNKVIEKLQLKDIETIHSRGEKLVEKYDVVVSRAVARIDKLLKICFSSVKDKGYLIAMKAHFDEEESYIPDNYKYDLYKFKLPFENSDRTLVKIEK